MPLKAVRPSRWDLSPAEARALQKQLAGQAEIRDRLNTPVLVAGIDVGFEEQGRITRAAVAVLRCHDLQLVESALARRLTRFPYVPGLLSFREIPAALGALAALACTPDLLLCDGQGLAHPRRFGLACHLGWLIDTPTIGVAKSRLLGAYAPPPAERGAWSPLWDRASSPAPPCAHDAASSRCSSHPDTGSTWRARCARRSPVATATACRAEPYGTPARLRQLIGAAPRRGSGT